VRELRKGKLFLVRGSAFCAFVKVEAKGRPRGGGGGGGCVGKVAAAVITVNQKDFGDSSA